MLHKRYTTITRSLIDPIHRFSARAPLQSARYFCMSQSASTLSSRSSLPTDISIAHLQRRSYVTEAEKFYTDLRVLNSAFEEARTAIDEARESTGTTYYAEDYEDAEKVTKVAMDKYQQMLKDTTDDAQRDQLNREHGQRMKQLDEEFKTLKAP